MVKITSERAAGTKMEISNIICSWDFWNRENQAAFQGTNELFKYFFFISISPALSQYARNYGLRFSYKCFQPSGNVPVAQKVFLKPTSLDISCVARVENYRLRSPQRSTRKMPTCHPRDLHCTLSFVLSSVLYPVLCTVLCTVPCPLYKIHTYQMHTIATSGTISRHPKCYFTV